MFDRLHIMKIDVFWNMTGRSRDLLMFS